MSASVQHLYLWSCVKSSASLRATGALPTLISLSRDNPPPPHSHTGEDRPLKHCVNGEPTDLKTPCDLLHRNSSTGTGIKQSSSDSLPAALGSGRLRVSFHNCYLGAEEHLSVGR